MKFTLKDYQEQAVDDVLANLKRARRPTRKPQCAGSKKNGPQRHNSRGAGEQRKG